MVTTETPRGSGYGVVLRAAQPEDVAAIAAVHDRSRCRAYSEILPSEIPEEFGVDRIEAEWQDLLADVPAWRILVTEHQGSIVGFVAFGPCRDDDLPVGSRAQ